jgi:hypothetical protein
VLKSLVKKLLSSVVAFVVKYIWVLWMRICVCNVFEFSNIIHVCLVFYVLYDYLFVYLTLSEKCNRMLQYDIMEVIFCITNFKYK